MLCQLRSKYVRASKCGQSPRPRLLRPINFSCRAGVDGRDPAQAGVSGEVQNIWLPSSSLLQSVCIEILPFGNGEVIAVTDVEKGSVAEEAGLATGQAIVGISDALRDDQIWPITARPSMRFVKQVLKMRMRGQVQLQIQWHEELQRRIEAAAGGAVSPPVEPQQVQPQAPEQGTEGAAKSAVSTLDTMLGGDTSASDDDTGSREGTVTVGEAMTKQFEATQVAKAETKGMSDVQQRKKRRAAYLGEVGKRNDAPLLLGLLLAFLGPAAIILGIAFYTGYIDNLVESSITIR